MTSTLLDVAPAEVAPAEKGAVETVERVAESGAPQASDECARTVQAVLQSIGLEAPPEPCLALAGGALWLRFDDRAHPAVLEGRHPDRLLRTFFACDVWAMRSQLLSDNLMSFLEAHAQPQLPIVVDLDMQAWRAGSADTEPPTPRALGRLVVTGVEGADDDGPTMVRGVGPEGQPGAWPASQVLAAVRRPANGPDGSATLHQPLVRQLDVDPRHLVRYGLRRVVGQMQQSIPDFGVTGLAAFPALRRHLAAGGTLGVDATDMGRRAFAELLPTAAEILERPALQRAGELFTEAASIWQALAEGSPTGDDAVSLVDQLESLERQAIDHMASALDVTVRVQVSESPKPTPSLGSYQHRRGVHCASMALHNLAHHYLGQKWSEALCFGLASGLNFTYLREPGSPMFLLMGRGSDMEEHFTDAVGGHLETFRSDDDERAWDHLLQQLEADRLVVLEADMFHLPYMVQSLELMEGVHFGGHKLFVTGYDAAAGTVVVQDYAWKEAITLPVDQLRLARGSQDCPEPPRNGCFVFHFPEQPTPLEEAIPRALRTLVQQMRHPFMQWNGLPAIERFGRQVARWSRVMKPEELELNVRLAGFMFERAGTGGGNFRNLYQRFLRQAAEVMDAPELAETASLYRRLAIAWRQVAALLDEAAEDPSQGLFDPAREPQALLNEIRTLERQGIDQIDHYLTQREAQ